MVLATATKASADSKVGIGLKADDGGNVVISSLAENGLFAGSDLRVGMRVTGINGKPCRGMAKEEAIRLIRESPGQVSISATEMEQEKKKTIVDPVVQPVTTAVAAAAAVPAAIVEKMRRRPSMKRTPSKKPLSMITAAVSKETKESKVGIGIKEGNVISSIASGGLFEETALMVGMRIVSVNNTSCDDLSKEETIALFRDAEGVITVLATTQPPEAASSAASGAAASRNEAAVTGSTRRLEGAPSAPGTAVKMLTATGVKETPSSMIGITVEEDEKDGILVSHLADWTIFAGTDLKVGQRIISVNNKACKGLYPNEAFLLFQQADRFVTVLATEEVKMEQPPPTEQEEKVILVPPPAPLLENLYPTPGVYTTIARKSYGPMGVGFRWGGKFGDPVTITKMSETSPLAKSVAEVGQVVLAISGQPVLGAKEAASIIGSAKPNELMNFTTCDGIKESVCKMVAGGTSVDNPGVVFNETRDGTLVQVSRVFKSGPFADTSLQEGDIVLAVNGVAVSRPEEADRLLELSAGDPFATIYCVDIHKFRQGILDEMLAYNPDLSKKVALEAKGYNEFELRSVEGGANNKKYKLCFDMETQYLADPDSCQHLVDPKQGECLGQHAETTVRFLSRYVLILLPLSLLILQENSIRASTKRASIPSWTSLPRASKRE
jgi:C-terminal processing protease CtpA/Prc